MLRGPMLGGIIQQFLQNVEWGDLDYLVIDLPPGTGDVQLTLTQRAPLSGGVIVTTPQQISLIDAEKGVKMFQQVKVPVLGVVENMSYFVCDGCDKKHHIFASGAGQQLAEKFKVPLLGEIPLIPMWSPAAIRECRSPSANRIPSASQAYRHLAGQVAAQISINQSQEVKKVGAGFELAWKG